jgi:predicted nucleic acid-binding protein
MTVYVEADFLIALAKDSDWLQERSREILDGEREVVTSATAYLEVLLVRDRDDFNFTRLVANLLELVPAGSEEEHQIVLKAVGYFEDGMTAFDAFHAATAETRRLPILSSDHAYEAVDPERLALEPEE